MSKKDRASEVSSRLQMSEQCERADKQVTQFTTH